MFGKEFKIDGYNNQFRFKNLNAIEILSLQTQIDFSNYEKSVKTFNMILENTEINLGDKWLPVKDKKDYYPVGIENDYKAIDKISKLFLEEIKSVFQKSAAQKT